VSAAIDLIQLKLELGLEIQRVTAKAERWHAMARRHLKVKDAFLRPAAMMREDCREAEKILNGCADPYALTVALDNLKGYNRDD